MSREAFNQLWATDPSNPGNDASFSVPRDSIWSTGWEGGADKDAPKAGEQNWWQNRADFALQDLERYGAMTWDADAIYSAGAPVRGSDGNYYESLANTNSGNNPVSTTGFWRPLGASLYGIVPVGAAIMVMHSGIPDIGWLKCNGAVLTRASYQRLFDKIQTTYNSGGESTAQFRLPDFRGVFPRGFDDSRNIDAGRVFGSQQKGTISVFGSGPTPDGIGVYTTSQGDAGQIETGMDSADLSIYPAVKYSNPGSTTTPIGAISKSEMTYGIMRPTNIAANFWIKY